MKIDIDLSEIFDEETGNVDASIKDVIINTVTQKIYNKIEREISQNVTDILKKGIATHLDKFLTELIPNLMDYEFQETGRYGEVKESKTTVKNKILKSLQEQCVFQAKNSYSGSRDNNPYTNAMLAIIEEQMRHYKPQFDKEVNAMFVKEAMDYAQNKLKEKLGIK